MRENQWQHNCDTAVQQLLSAYSFLVCLYVHHTDMVHMCWLMALSSNGQS